MAVLSICEGYTGCQAGGSAQKKTSLRVFTMVSDTPADGPLSFTFPLTAGAVTIPDVGTGHPDDGDYLSGVPQVVKKGPTFFAVTVPYETVDETSVNSNQSPLAQPTELAWDDAERQVPYSEDLDGNPAVNTMDEPFDPPLTREISDPVLIVTRNQAAFYPDDKLLYQDTVCTELFLGAAIGRVRLGKIKAQTLTRAGVTCWRVRYEIIFRMKTPTGVLPAKAWWRCVLNQGVKYFDTGGQQRISPNGEMLLLDTDGYVTTAAAPHWLYFREYDDQAWATALALP